MATGETSDVVVTDSQEVIVIDDAEEKGTISSLAGKK